MAELDLGGRSYHDVVKEVSEVAADLLRNGADTNATMGAISLIDRKVVSQMDEEQFARFSGMVAWEGATAVISDPEADPTHAYDLLTAQTNNLSHAASLAEYGKDLDKFGGPTERAHKVLRLASEAFVEVWDSMQDQPLDQRIAFYTEEYQRIVDLQEGAGDQEGEAITAERIVDSGESLLIEARASSDDKLARRMNDSLRELAWSLPGGIENPRAQRLLRITSAEGKNIDFLELWKLEDTADTLLKSGMIDAAFAVYMLTDNFDPDKVRETMQKRGRHSEEEIEEHIRLATGSFPGSPWDAILELQQQPDTEEYVDQILDRIKEEYPTTYQWFSYGQYMRDRAAYDVLINVGRSEELAEIVKANASSEEAPNLRFMASRMAVMIVQAGKLNLYEQVVAATLDVPGAKEALEEGRTIATSPEEGN